MDLFKSFSWTIIFNYLKSNPIILKSILDLLSMLTLLVLRKIKRQLKGIDSINIFSLKISFIINFLVFAYLIYNNEIDLTSINAYILIVFSLFISWLLIFVALFLTEDNTAMGKHDDPIEKDIPDIKFKKKIKLVTEALTLSLRDIDIQTNWSALNFVALDAEVEVIKNGTNKYKKVLDLLTAIKIFKKERIFLVIGEPGSGKSVSLRKLCQDLSKEVEKTGKIPIYINLKEWQCKWDNDSLPTINQLTEFVIENLRKRDKVTSDFFGKYYDRMYDQGKLYFVFDSFDEIPGVLGENENSLIIRKLSSVMHEFMQGARDNSQGIIASRIFRKPTRELKTNITLEIRPFNETKITETFISTLGYDDNTVKKLFSERYDLLAAASNPFTTSLMASYADENNNKLPINILDLYENFFNKSLEESSYIIKARDLSYDVILNASIDIAYLMFNKYGFEAPIRDLKDKIYLVDGVNMDDIIDVLTFARIGRKSHGSVMFSFAHRRFCEYLLVKRILIADQELPLNDIPKDSQWRDALVMYCHVASKEKALSIANFCWDILKDINKPQDLDAIHTARFLRDAFKTRKDCIVEFKENLSKYILDQIASDRNMITAKLAIECLGLLDQEDIDKGAILALETSNNWITEAAFKECRTITKASDSLKNKILNHFSHKPFYNFYKFDNSILFSLNLSISLQGLIKRYKSMVFYQWAFVFSLLAINVLYNFIPIDPNAIRITTKQSTLTSFLGLCLCSLFIGMMLRAFPLMISFKRFILFQFVSLISCMIPCWAASERLYICIMVFVSLIPIIFIFEIYGFKRMIMDIKNFILNEERITVVIMSFVVSLTILSIVFFGPANMFIFLNLFIVMIVILSMISIGYFYLKFNKLFGKINYRECNNREYLHSIVTDLLYLLPSIHEDNLIRVDKKYKYNIENFLFFKHLVSSEICNYFLNKLINYLEVNIKEVHGQWPDDSIFSFKSRRRPLERLAQLEVKWLGIK